MVFSGFSANNAKHILYIWIPYGQGNIWAVSDGQQMYIGGGYWWFLLVLWVFSVILRGLFCGFFNLENSFGFRMTTFGGVSFLYFLDLRPIYRFWVLKGVFFICEGPK